MGDGSKVDIHALSKFGSDTTDSLKDYQQGVGGPTGMIMKGQMGGAALGTNESQTFHDYYGQSVADATSKFLSDSPKGIMALGFGAVVEAGNYAEGDTSQANAMAVVNLFNQDPNKGLDGDIAKQNTDVTDKTKVKPLPAPDTPDDVNNNVCRIDKPTPIEQVAQHDSQYGQWETWKPVDPNAQPDVDYSEPLGPGEI